jgi:CheY-like chemotaxis protein
MGSTGGQKRQADRRHIFAVNHDPDFLDVVRELLQDERYTVSTTNFVPRTWDQIAALQPSLLLVDLSPRRQEEWELLERLHAEGVTERIPIVVTSTDRRLLERVERERDRFGGSSFLAAPLDIYILLDAIHALIGPASPREGPDDGGGARPPAARARFLPVRGQIASARSVTLTPAARRGGGLRGTASDDR